MLKKNRYLILLILFVVILIVCTVVNESIETDNIGRLSQYYDKQDKSYFKQYSIAEENYCFYFTNANFLDNCSQNDIYYGADVSLYFPASVKDIDFSELKIYCDGKQVGTDNENQACYTAVLNDDGSVQLRMNSYVSMFDCISGVYNDKEYLFYTGKYYFEKIDIADFEKYGFHGMNYNDYNYKLTSEINVVPENHKGNFVIPDKVVEKGYTDLPDITYDKNSNITKMNLNINKNSLLSSEIERFSFESLWLVLDDNGKNFITKRVNVYELPVN